MCWLCSGCCAGSGISVGALSHCGAHGTPGSWLGLGAEAFGSIAATVRAQGFCVLHCHFAGGAASSSVSDDDKDDGERQQSCHLHFLFFFLEFGQVSGSTYWSEACLLGSMLSSRKLASVPDISVGVNAKWLLKSCACFVILVSKVLCCMLFVGYFCCCLLLLLCYIFFLFLTCLLVFLPFSV